MLRIEVVGAAGVPRDLQSLKIDCQTVGKKKVLFSCAESEISRGGEVLIDAQFFVMKELQDDGGLVFKCEIIHADDSVDEYESVLQDSVIQTLKQNMDETTMRALAFQPSSITLHVMMDFLAVFAGSKKTRQNLREQKRLAWLKEHLATLNALETSDDEQTTSPEREPSGSAEDILLKTKKGVSGQTFQSGRLRNSQRRKSGQFAENKEERSLPVALSGQLSGGLYGYDRKSGYGYGYRPQRSSSASSLGLSRQNSFGTTSGESDTLESEVVVKYACERGKCGVVRKCFVSRGDFLLYGAPIAEISLFDNVALPFSMRSQQPGGYPFPSMGATDEDASEDSGDSTLGQYVLREASLLGQYTMKESPLLGQYVMTGEDISNLTDSGPADLVETSVLVKWDKETPALVTKVLNATPNKGIVEGLNQLIRADESPRAQQQCFLFAADRMSYQADRETHKANSKFPKLAERLASLVKSGNFSTQISETTHLCNELERVARDFYETARTYGRVIINEMHLPVEMKTVRPLRLGGVLGGHKYVVRGVLFKIPNADTFSSYPDPLHIANKVQGHELKGLRSYFGWFFNEGSLDRCSFPLTALLDYKGHRITAMTQLPINGSETLVYGSDDASKECQVSNELPEFSDLIRRASMGLNLKPHYTVNGRSQGGEIEIASCVDLEGHHGFDERNYLLDFSRTFPTAYKSKEDCASYDQLWPFYHMMRPEFVAQYDKPLCSDSFSNFQSRITDEREQAAQEHNQTVQLATMQLQSRVVMQVCKALMEGVGKVYSVSYVFHRHGLNMRYLGLVYAQITSTAMYKAACQNLYLLLQVEALVRVVKAELRMRMRNYQGQSESGLRAEALVVLNGFFGTHKDFERFKACNAFAKEALTSRFNFSADVADKVLSSFYRSNDVLEEISFSGQKSTSSLKHASLVRLNAVMGLGLSAGLLLELKAGRAEGRSMERRTVFHDDDLNFEERVKNLDIVERVLGIRHFLAGKAAVKHQKYGLALEKFLQAHRTLFQALEANPSDVFLCMLAGDVCMQIFQLKKKGDPQRAFFLDSCESLYRQAVATDRKSPAAQLRLGTMLATHRPKLADEAEDHLLKSIELQSDTPSMPTLVLSSLIKVLKAKGNEDAVKTLQQYAAPSSPNVKRHSIGFQGERAGPPIDRSGSPGADAGSENSSGRASSFSGPSSSSPKPPTLAQTAHLRSSAQLKREANPRRRYSVNDKEDDLITVTASPPHHLMRVGSSDESVVTKTLPPPPAEVEETKVRRLQPRHSLINLFHKQGRGKKKGGGGE